MFKRKNWNKPFSEAVARRVKRLPTDQMVTWVETSSYEITRCIREYQKSGEKFFLDEALTGAEAMHAIVDELHKRSVL